MRIIDSYSINYINQCTTENGVSLTFINRSYLSTVPDFPIKEGFTKHVSCKNKKIMNNNLFLKVPTFAEISVALPMDFFENYYFSIASIIL